MISNSWTPGFQIHLISWPVATQPLFDHSKSRQVRISDPHSVFQILFKYTTLLEEKNVTVEVGEYQS